MSAYLSAAQIAARAVELTAEFERLLASPRIVMRPKSKQWAFLRHCFDIVVAGRSADHDCTPQQALQYRFEAEDRLRRYYLAPGRPVAFVFTLMHAHRARALELVNEDYPVANGYVLLVTEDRTGQRADDPTDVRDVLERVVADAGEAEWAVYQRLPAVELTPLERSFRAGGPAYRRIQHLAERHHERRWTLTEPHNNPSTKRLIDVKVVKLRGDHAEIRTKEYWYLRWYALDRRDYAQIDWRETNTQTYILTRSGSRWLVEDNIYPPPRNSTPHRKGMVVG